MLSPQLFADSKRAPATNIPNAKVSRAEVMPTVCVASLVFMPTLRLSMGMAAMSPPRPGNSVWRPPAMNPTMNVFRMDGLGFDKANHSRNSLIQRVDDLSASAPRSQPKCTSVSNFFIFTKSMLLSATHNSRQLSMTWSTMRRFGLICMPRSVWLNGNSLLLPVVHQRLSKSPFLALRCRQPILCRAFRLYSLHS